MGDLKKIQDWALYLFAFSLSFEYWDAFGFKNFSIGAITGYIYFFSMILNFQYRNIPFNIGNYLIPTLGFFTILTVMSFINFSDVNGIPWFNISILQCIILFIVLIIHLSNRIAAISRNVLFSYLMGCLLLIVLYSFGFGVSYSVDHRLTVFDSGPNGLGFIGATGLIILLSTVFENKSKTGWRRYLLFLFLPFILKLIAETGSRGAFIILSLGVIIFFLFIKVKFKYKLLYPVLVSIFTFAIFQIIVFSDVLQNRLLLTIISGDTSQRTDIWSSAFPAFLNNPIFGVGETGYYNIARRFLVNYQGPHNVFIEVLVYSGIIGFGFFSVIIYRTFVKSLYVLRLYNYVLPITLFCMVIILFLNGQGLFIKLVWLIFAICISLSKSYSYEKHIDSNRS